MKLKTLLLTVTSLVLLSLPVVAFAQRQEIFDWIRLRDYVAPPEIAALASDAAMNDHARRLFYVYHPELQDKVAFNQSCSGSETTIVLGCYVGGQGIYIFRVEDARLEGIEEVTAAHEMLHVAYERLDGDEKARIDVLTRQAYELVTSERIRKAVAAYAERDPSVVPNELHSIVGTEVRELPAGLETYYQRYFTDRSRVVALSEQYERAFTEREAQVKTYDEELAGLRSQIDTLQGQLDSSLGRLNAERTRMERLLADGETEAYNQAVPGYNSQVQNYNAVARRLQGLIDTFNTTVAKRNALVVEEQQLVEAIDSRPSTIQTQ